MSMYYTIYKITNKINGKIYIGKHQTTNINDSYYGSGAKLLLAIEKYGKQNFIKEVLFTYDNEHDMNEKEKEIITEEFVSRKDTYNIGVGGEGGPHFKGKTHSLESRIKMGRFKNRTHSTETKAKIAEANRNRKVSDKTKQKIAEKAKIREAQKKLKRTSGQVTMPVS